MNELYARKDFKTRTQRVRAGDLVTASVLADAPMSEAEMIGRGFVERVSTKAKSEADPANEATPPKPAKRR